MTDEKEDGRVMSCELDVNASIFPPRAELILIKRILHKHWITVIPRVPEATII